MSERRLPWCVWPLSWCHSHTGRVSHCHGPRVTLSRAACHTSWYVTPSRLRYISALRKTRHPWQFSCACMSQCSGLIYKQYMNTLPPVIGHNLLWPSEQRVMISGWRSSTSHNNTRIPSFSSLGINHCGQLADVHQPIIWTTQYMYRSLIWSSARFMLSGLSIPAIYWCRS